jgi:hypothetical protein
MERGKGGFGALFLSTNGAGYGYYQAYDTYEIDWSLTYFGFICHDMQSSHILGDFHIGRGGFFIQINRLAGGHIE